VRSLVLLFIASVVGVAVWAALTMPDFETDDLDDKDWYDL